jgi:hypothetical protein
MISSRVNLRCSAGHGHYAPAREWPEWVGKVCGAGARMTGSGTTSPGLCRRALAPTQALVRRGKA